MYLEDSSKLEIAESLPLRGIVTSRLVTELQMAKTETTLLCEGTFFQTCNKGFLASFSSNFLH